ncbi:MAG: family transcriptional regulator [Cryobacterium sp.]|jgi:predicted NBD/HSP70 family sugar kinase|nr:family transcriptional regulator [Cryobacterium sp.]
MSDDSRLAPPVAAGASSLFQELRDGRPRTRAELAATTGLGRSTVAARVDALMGLGLVMPVEDAVSTGGRPSSRFAFNPSSRLILAADLGASHASVALTDLAGTFLARRSGQQDIAAGPEQVLGWLIAQAHSMFEELERSASDLVGVGVGLPGPVQHQTGRPINPPIMPGWDRFDVPGWVRERLSAPVLVDNDVNIMALGERAYAWPDADHLIFVKIATGIGAGIISGGSLQRGSQGIAGDIGHVQVARGRGIACHCGNLGCLEAIAAGPAIAKALKLAGIDVATGQDVVDLVKHGHIEAIQAVRQAGRDIGEVLTACVSLVNPSVIALGGSMSQAGEHLLAGVREIVYTRCMPLATENLSVVQSRAGADAAVIGASMLAIEHALSPESIGSMAWT